MALPDTKLRTYLRAFFSDWFTGMSGPLSVPFAAIALWSSGRVQKVLWGCLAVVVGVFGSYRVWRKERIDASSRLESLRAEKDADAARREAEIADLKARITELTRDQFTEDLMQRVRQVVGNTMTLSGQLLLHWLLINEPVQCEVLFMPEISAQTQFEQMEIAVKSGIVRREQEQAGLWRTMYKVNPQIKPVLQKVLPELLRDRQRA